MIIEISAARPFLGANSYFLIGDCWLIHAFSS